jgi:poly(3-hydroxybutyrate) depolymerase
VIQVLYQLREFHRALFGPAAQLARTGALVFSSPASWFAQLPGAANVAAGYELFYRLGKEYGKPAFGIESVEVRGARVPVIEQTVLALPFCRLTRFTRLGDDPDRRGAVRDEPVVLLVAPLSGHHATLLRDAVQSLLADHDVYVTDWIDAREVPLRHGPFALADYVSYIRAMVRHIGAERLHLVAICQAAVPVLAAVSLMASAGDPQPGSLTLMGGPIDARRSPTAVSRFACGKPLAWFERQLLHHVPWSYPGAGRRVYPGFLQHASFIAMNPVRHVGSHWDFYRHLVSGELDSADAHRRFYDEYNAVLDLTAEFYLDCIRIVFQQHLLPQGLWQIGGERVAPRAIDRSALLTIEGDLDDISGLGQTEAAHDLCAGIPASRKQHFVVPGAGHYGIFSGRRWREIVYPRVRDFIAAADRGRSTVR